MYEKCSGRRSLFLTMNLNTSDQTIHIFILINQSVLPALIAYFVIKNL